MRRLLGKVIAVVFATILCMAGAAAERVDSGYQTINGTQVYTQIFYDRGYATFSNSCGSQNLTQAQLQAGAIPNRIIPCPRRNNNGGRRQSMPPGADDCGGGKYCDAGSICMKGNKCLSKKDPRYCGGRRYCNAGYFCDENECYSTKSPRYCGNGRFCDSDSVCDRSKPPGSARCIKLSAPRVCSDGSLCNESAFCTKERMCVSTSAARYCGNGKYCGADEACNSGMPAGSKRCFKLSSPRYCGNRKFCKEGYVCKDENTCVAESAPGSAAPRTVSQSDCSCISVIPTVPGREYNVTNSCGRMFVSVRFGGDTLHVSPRVGAFTSWIDAGELSVGEIGTVKPPAHWTISSITGISIRSGDSSFTCTF